MVTGDLRKDLGDLWKGTWEEFCEEWQERMDHRWTTAEMSQWVLVFFAIWYVCTGQHCA